MTDYKDYKKLCAELVEIWDNTSDPDYYDFGDAARYLVIRARDALAEPEPESEEPVVGELVVVAHWGDFDYPMDAVRLGRLRETQEQDGKTYYYVDDLRRGFRHCRTLTPRVLPVKEAVNASITTPSTHHPTTHD